MAKNKPGKPVWYGIFPDGEQRVDSYEEAMFSHWCFLLYKEGWIKDYKRGNTYVLSPQHWYDFNKRLKTKHSPTKRELMNSHEYTPDFTILWRDKAKYVFFDPLGHGESYDFSAEFMGQLDVNEWFSVVEVKPVFDKNNMTRLAKINIQWTYYKYDVFVNLIIPIPKNGGSPATTLFRKTFFPHEATITAIDKKPKKFGFKPRTYEQFIEERLKYVESISPKGQVGIF